MDHILPSTYWRTSWFLSSLAILNNEFWWMSFHLIWVNAKEHNCWIICSLITCTHITLWDWKLLEGKEHVISLRNSIRVWCTLLHRTRTLYYIFCFTSFPIASSSPPYLLYFLLTLTVQDHTHTIIPIITTPINFVSQVAPIQLCCCGM